MENNDGSFFKVCLTRILNIQPHPDPETVNLEIATVYGFEIVVGKGSYRIGDLVYFVPIDSIIPTWLEELVFNNSKIKPNKGRIRQIKIRKFPSQGLLINPELIPDSYFKRIIKEEEDIAEMLGIVKYEPPFKGPARTVGKGPRNKTYENKLFHKYNGLTALKWVPTIFDGETVIIQEKLHGTNARAGILPYEANTLWKKFLKFIGYAPTYEKCYGSNNVEISAKVIRKTCFYEGDIYGEAFKKCDVFSKLKPGEIVYGEIIGPDLQKNYTYGLTERKFVMFDYKVLQEDGSFKWATPDEAKAFAHERGFEFVPILWEGVYDKEIAYRLTFGPSVYSNAQKVREGIVVKAKENYSNEGNKKAYKWVSEDYLSDKSNTDNH